MAKNNQQVQQQNYPPFNGRLTQNGEIIPTVEITINEGQPTAFNHHLGELSMVQMSIPNAVPFVDSYRNENDDLKQNLL
ncbi:hypothetical protein TRFO_39077 [Tritrichomonas foetus]|uniref:Uncharacterized protein n=1 Tax=Tritrichomonas foetus TaxID=1144522 RepID=A0A1J4J6A4_9EUKA|nr:hypothetical protein TRFO_39077 [Tritrichomonas foetus]|eukprot:OHS94728.1 hypothetical protein TRFO_39077 [Tritrichomonas foetus]